MTKSKAINRKKLVAFVLPIIAKGVDENASPTSEHTNCSEKQRQFCCCRAAYKDGDNTVPQKQDSTMIPYLSPLFCGECFPQTLHMKTECINVIHSVNCFTAIALSRLFILFQILKRSVWHRSNALPSSRWSGWNRKRWSGNWERGGTGRFRRRCPHGKCCRRNWS